MSQFRITRAKGFHITFPNRHTVSVQFGAGNYCDNYDADFDANPKEGWQSSTAECAVWNGDREWVRVPGFNEGDDVIPRLTSDRVLALMNAVAALPDKA